MAGKKTSKQVKVTLLFDSDYNGSLYEAGKEYEVDEETAQRLLQIDKVLKKENS